MEVVLKKLTESEIEKLKIKTWPIWEKEISEFDWAYEEEEKCYFLKGEVVVTWGSGKSLQIKAGDFIIFPKGLACRWKISKAVKKHYSFG